MAQREHTDRVQVNLRAEDTGDRSHPFYVQTWFPIQPPASSPRLLSLPPPTARPPPPRAPTAAGPVLRHLPPCPLPRTGVLGWQSGPLVTRGRAWHQGDGWCRWLAVRTGGLRGQGRQHPGMGALRVRLRAGGPKRQLQPFELLRPGASHFTLLPSVFLDLPFLQSDFSPKLGVGWNVAGGAGPWCPWWSEGSVGDEAEAPCWGHPGPGMRGYGVWLLPRTGRSPASWIR